MPKAADVGVIVGRFQVHLLHDAHRSIIQPIYDACRTTVIVLGLSAAKVSTRNPLDFEARKQLLLAEYPNATVLYLKDHPSDTEWSKQLDRLIGDVASPAQSVRLYGGRDSFAGRYSGKYAVETLEPDTFLSGTELRRDISKGVKASADFRAGVIWASANRYPVAFPTVDVAIWRLDTEGKELPIPAALVREWLFVRKPTETLWRFCGGFVDPADTGLEAAARREVSEETGVEIGALEYVWSGRVDDWRYRDEADKIITTLFKAPFVFGPVRPADDVAEAMWIKETDLTPAQVVPEHRPLVTALLGAAPQRSTT